MPAKTEKQRKFMGAELARKRAGKKTKTGMSEKKLEEFASKGKGKKKLAGAGAGIRDDIRPEFDGRAFVQQAHPQRLPSPVLNRPLASSRLAGHAFEARVFLVCGQPRAMDRELFLGESQP
jgi:hypothetical protein